MPEIYKIFARKKIVFARIWGGGQLPPSPVSYAYGLHRPRIRLNSLLETLLNGASEKQRISYVVLELRTIVYTCIVQCYTFSHCIVQLRHKPLFQFLYVR